MKKAFTLIELLVVMGIMGLMGTVSVIGFRQVQRGMEERGVLDNVSQFVRAAYQRAQIERSSVAVYFWNVTEREETDEENVVTHGKAVVVRKMGRLSDKNGSFLIDEFGYLKDARYETPDPEDQDDEERLTQDRPSPGKGNGLYLYQMKDGGEPRKTLVGMVTVPMRSAEFLPNSHFIGQANQNGKIESDIDGYTIGIEAYAYEAVDGEPHSFWQTGDAYGQEVAMLVLPDGYLFGSDYSKSVSSPEKFVRQLWITPGVVNGSGAASGSASDLSMEICSLLPDKSGRLSPQSIGKSVDPTRSGGK